MPDIERHGVTLGEALQEAIATARQDRALLYAYELWHPTFTDPIYFVDNTEDLVATLEPNAPRAASETVTFLACPVSLQRPEEGDQAGNPKLVMQRPGVSGLMRDALNAARAVASLDPFEIIERVYASDDTSSPEMLPPLTMEVTAVELAGITARLEATFGDFANVMVPRAIFRRSQYPGLQR
jgi:hypothetical protein